LERNEESNLDKQISDYCKKQNAKFQNLEKNNLRKFPGAKYETTKNETTSSSPITHENTVPVIGDYGKKH
jgi:hypothetical protein